MKLCKLSTYGCGRDPDYDMLLDSPKLQETRGEDAAEEDDVTFLRQFSAAVATIFEQDNEQESAVMGLEELCKGLEKRIKRMTDYRRVAEVLQGAWIGRWALLSGPDAPTESIPYKVNIEANLPTRTEAQGRLYGPQRCKRSVSA